MKTLKVFKQGGEVEEYHLHERATTHPQEFVKDIIYKDGNYSVEFSDYDPWFKTFTNFPCEYLEFNEMKIKSNAPELLDRDKH